MNQYTSILQAAGLPQDQIDALEAIEADKVKDLDPAPYVQGITTAMKTKLLADPTTYDTLTEDKLPETTRKKIESGQYGRFMNELVDVATKELGLKEGEDFAAEDKGKLKVLAGKIAKQFAAKGSGDAGVKKLQADLLLALEEKNTLDTTWKTKYDTDMETTKNSATGKLEQLAFQTNVATISDLKVKPGIVASSIMADMKAKYAVTLNPDTLEFTIKQKDHPTLDVIHEGKPLTFKTALELSAVSLDLIGEKKTPVKKEGNVNIDVDGDVVVPKYIQDKM